MNDDVIATVLNTLDLEGRDRNKLKTQLDAAVIKLSLDEAFDLAHELMESI